MKRVCSGRMDFNNETARVCVHLLADMKPSDLKNKTAVNFLLQNYLKLKNKPKLTDEICRKLAKAFTMKYANNSMIKPGLLVKCMKKPAKDIVEHLEIVKVLAKSKKKKGLKRDILKEMVRLCWLFYVDTEEELKLN